jgi:transcription initiation factor TFIIIB Brf1 subunit/transcription initiation factor TFIIB
MVYRQINNNDPMKSAECPECHSKRLLFKGGKLICTNCDHVIGQTFNKYGAKKSTYNGYNYDSKFESQIAQDLDLRLKAGGIKEVQKQVKIDLQAYGKHITNYFIDFVVTHNDLSKEYIEVKGYETDVWKMKWKMFEAKINSESSIDTSTVIKQRTYKR